VGEGDLQKELKIKDEQYEISQNVRIIGWSDDTVALMKSSSVFVFPRLEYPKEGLGLVVVEAQAAGLPMAISHAIVKDAIVISELANYINYRNNPEEWAEKIEMIISEPAPISKYEALTRVQQSPFDLRRATENLIKIYESDE